MLKENLDKIFLNIKDGNNFGEPITLVGATKTVSVDVINQAVALGLKVVAENKVQEFNLKHDFISPNAKQHFIGHLQTNKVKYIIGKVDLIHSVDSVHLAEEIDKQAQKKQVVQDVLMEVNIGGELSKSGFDRENAIENAIKISALPHLRLVGLMAMLPKLDDENALISLAKSMRELFDKLKIKGLPMKYLSMGMSGDYKIAINNGSNMIRLGRDIFGQRNYGENKDGII